MNERNSDNWSETISPIDLNYDLAVGHRQFCTGWWKEIKIVPLLIFFYSHDSVWLIFDTRSFHLKYLFRRNKLRINPGWVSRSETARIFFFHFKYLELLGFWIIETYFLAIEKWDLQNFYHRKKLSTSIMFTSK